MNAEQWYDENKLRTDQRVFETASQFWVFVKENEGGTFRIASNDAVIRGYVRSHRLDAFATFEAAEVALEQLTHQFVLTPVEVGS